MALSKRTEERAWLGEVSDVALQQSLHDLEGAYSAFFSRMTKKKAGKLPKGARAGAPRFKSRRDGRQAFRITGKANTRVRKVSATRAQVWIPKIGWVGFALSRPLPSVPSSYTVVHEPDGRYYVSFVVETPAWTAPDAAHQAAGVDLGLGDLAVIVHDDGTVEKVPAPRHLRTQQRKLARAQRELARRQKGSANRDKSRTKVAAIHRKVRDARTDHHHKLARRIVDENQVIGLETLGITAPARTRMARSIHDAAWGILVRRIQEKGAETGRTVVRAPRNFPSTRMCHACGHVREPVPLNVRSWACACGAIHDRDTNAAINLREYALKTVAAGPAQQPDSGEAA